jgi:hypothetical protein
MAPLEPDHKLAVTLTAQEWNNVLGALNEAPHRIAAPLIRQIVAQIEGRAVPVEAEHIPATRKGNGRLDPPAA